MNVKIRNHDAQGCCKAPTQLTMQLVIQENGHVTRHQNTLYGLAGACWYKVALRASTYLLDPDKWVVLACIQVCLAQYLLCNQVLPGAIQVEGVYAHNLFIRCTRTLCDHVAPQTEEVASRRRSEHGCLAVMRGGFFEGRATISSASPN